MRMTRQTYQLAGLLVTCLLVGGCSQAANMMLSRTVTVTAADDVCNKSVEVHLVGVNRFEKDRWENMSMTQYWQPDNPLRKGAAEHTYVIQFGRKPCERVLAKKDPIIKVWKERKAEYLFVLADLPGVFPDLPGNADARRLELPALDSADWGWQKSIDIAINSSDVVALVIPKAKSQ